MASQNSSTSPSSINCFSIKTGHYIMPLFTAALGFFVFPLYFLVLLTGFQRWRKNKRSAVSHTDFFTYNNVFFELLWFSGFCVISCAFYQSDENLLTFGTHVVVFVSPGVLSMHALTCVERYLAVVHPVVYLSLRKQKWIWARNLMIVVIWVMCILFTFVVWVSKQYNIPSLCLLGIVTSIVIVCSIQALRALRNPSPGEGQGVSKSKRKAFFTMSAILFTLMMWFTVVIAFNGFHNVYKVEYKALCEFQISSCWFQLPTSLVLPVLFLHRAGKLPKCQGKKR